jgi:hypothetical protein
MAYNDSDGGSGPLSIPHTKGFKVDPDALLDVAKQVDSLIDDVTGDTGYSGNLKRFIDEAKSDALGNSSKGGLGELYGDDNNIFRTSYDDVRTGVQKTYQAMQEQLKQLSSACRSTAQQYQHHDDQAKSDVSQPGGEI